MGVVAQDGLTCCGVIVLYFMYCIGVEVVVQDGLTCRGGGPCCNLGTVIGVEVVVQDGLTWEDRPGMLLQIMLCLGIFIMLNPGKK